MVWLHVVPWRASLARALHASTRGWPMRARAPRRALRRPRLPRPFLSLYGL